MQKWSKRHRMKIITTHIPRHCPRSLLAEGAVGDFFIKVRACARILITVITPEKGLLFLNPLQRCHLFWNWTKQSRLLVWSGGMSVWRQKKPRRVISTGRGTQFENMVSGNVTARFRRRERQRRWPERWGWWWWCQSHVWWSSLYCLSWWVGLRFNV